MNGSCLFENLLQMRYPPQLNFKHSLLTTHTRHFHTFLNRHLARRTYRQVLLSRLILKTRCVKVVVTGGYKCRTVVFTNFANRVANLLVPPEYIVLGNLARLPLLATLLHTNEQIRSNRNQYDCRHAYDLIDKHLPAMIIPVI